MYKLYILCLTSRGLLPNDTWSPTLPAWIQTPELHDFLLSVAFTESTIFYNTPDYRDDSDPNKRDNYLNLRENTDAMVNINGQVTTKWVDFISQNQNSQPGDLIFLRDPSEYSGAWSHVEVITGWGAETTHDTNIVNGIQEPLVVDHDGRVTDPSKLPRSVGDTSGDHIEQVLFLHAP